MHWVAYTFSPRRVSPPDAVPSPVAFGSVSNVLRYATIEVTSG